MQRGRAIPTPVTEHLRYGNGERFKLNENVRVVFKSRVKEMQIGQRQVSTKRPDKNIAKGTNKFTL